MFFTAMRAVFVYKKSQCENWDFLYNQSVIGLIKISLYKLLARDFLGKSCHVQHHN